jgi:competence protein ComGC
VLLITVPHIAQKRRSIHAIGCKALVEVVDAQILLYELDNGERPDSVADLVANGYITEAQTVCPDGTMIGIEDGEAVAD